MQEDLTRSTILANPDDGLPPPPSFSRFVHEKLLSQGIPAAVESLKSTTRTFLLISLAGDAPETAQVLADHGNAMAEWLQREVRAAFGEQPTFAGVYWRVVPPAIPAANSPFEKARADLEAKIRQRRAARAPASSPLGSLHK